MPGTTFINNKPEAKIAAQIAREHGFTGKEMGWDSDASWEDFHKRYVSNVFSAWGMSTNTDAHEAMREIDETLSIRRQEHQNARFRNVKEDVDRRIEKANLEDQEWIKKDAVLRGAHDVPSDFIEGMWSEFDPDAYSVSGLVAAIRLEWRKHQLDH